jgi:hypothetical protein
VIDHAARDDPAVTAFARAQELASVGAEYADVEVLDEHGFGCRPADADVVKLAGVRRVVTGIRRPAGTRSTDAAQQRS